MTSSASTWQKVWAYRSTWWIILPPILLLPIPLVFQDSVSACGYTILLMAIYWISEAVPLAVTAFLPLIIFPVSGIMSAEAVSSVYFKDTTFLFIGGLLVAISVETSGLHKRIALRVLLFVGPKPHCLMFGFMFTTFFLSMWISNTATTAMMLPIVEAVFKELQSSNADDDDSEKLQESETSSTIKMQITSFNDNEAYESDKEEQKGNDLKEVSVEITDTKKSGEQKLRLNEFVKGISISIPYSSSIGGTVTLTGTAPNLVLAGQFETLFPDSDVALSFGNWIAYNIAGASVLLVLAYIWLSVFYLGLGSFKNACLCSGENPEDKRVTKIVKREYKKLGSIRWGEMTVFCMFILVVLLWFFREPGFMPGYAIIFPEPEYVKDGTVAMTVAFFLFILPGSKPEFLKSKQEIKDSEIESKRNLAKPVPAVLTWNTVQHKFPWDILFLIAGGFALAEGSEVSGFSKWMGDQLTFLDGIEPWAICLVVTLIVCIFTECSSNTATASLFVPILAELAKNLCVHPLYLMLPPVLASSLAFMLPVATPPNAIAFSFGHLKVIDLVKAGWLMNLLGVGVISLFINTYGISFWGLDEFPAWAVTDINQTSCEVTP